MGIENIFLFCGILLCIALVIDFIVLIIKYQKERYLPICFLNEKDILDTHGTVISSCILQKRGMLPRDIIATIVELIQMDAITIEMSKTSEDGKIITQYRLYKSKCEIKFNDIQQEVMNILFRDANECLLNSEVKKIRRKIETINLSNMVKKRLEEIGANAIKVPRKVQLVNNLFFVLVCLFFFMHVIHNFDSSLFFENYKSNLKFWIIMIIKIDALVILFTMLTKMLVLLFERLTNKSVKSKIELTDGNVVDMFIKFLLTNCIILIFLVFAGNNMHFIVDILLLDIAMVVMVSDDTFIAHSPKLKKEYLSLQNFESRLETNEILEFYSQDKEDLLKQYIPFLIACNFKKINMLDYIDKMMQATMDKNEKEKYSSILKLVNFEEDSINQFYFSNSIKEKK